jgi:hypothetical protein
MGVWRGPTPRPTVPSPTGYPPGAKGGTLPDLSFWYPEHASVLGLALSWALGRPAVVLDVPEHATSLHFGVLLGGAGAVDLAKPSFEAVSTEVPVTVKQFPPLPDEPQALNFGQAAAT